MHLPGKKVDFSEIVEGKLWIGSSPSHDDLVRLKEDLGSNLVVVDLNRNLSEEDACREAGVAYDMRTPIVEDSGSPIPVSKLRLVARIIDDNIRSGRQVYLHCSAGRGRSPTCAAAYLVYSGMSLSEAKEMVARKRRVWEGGDANYAGLLGEFAGMQEMAREAEG